MQKSRHLFLSWVYYLKKTKQKTENKQTKEKQNKTHTHTQKQNKKQNKQKQNKTPKHHLGTRGFRELTEPSKYKFAIYFHR